MNFNWHNPLPLDGWFLAASSGELGARGVVGFDLPGRPLVVYRGEDGKARAAAAHCPHMGAHLRHGTVRGNAIQCPLHHRRFEAVVGGDGGDGRDEAQCLPGLTTREACGGVWVLVGTGDRTSTCEADFPFPLAADVEESSLFFKHGRPVLVRCPWQAIVANAFDLNHFQQVHKRAMAGQPSVADLGSRIEFRYVSSVTGSSPADRVMRLLSGNRIDVTICCHGSVMTVRTRTRSRQTFLWLSFVPVGEGTLVKPVYAVQRGRMTGLAWLRAQVAGWLFNAFLRNDIGILDHMRFAPHLAPGEDPYLQAYLQFIARRHAPRPQASDEPMLALAT